MKTWVVKILKMVDNANHTLKDNHSILESKIYMHMHSYHMSCRNIWFDFFMLLFLTFIRLTLKKNVPSKKNNWFNFYMLCTFNY